MSFDSARPEPAVPVAFRFTGSGGEYFRIWIVNLLLTLLTLGIYSAWAKVRRLKYFYGNTELAGGTFDYHGSPIAILKGRLIAIGLFLLYNVATSIVSVWSAIALVLLAALLPWLLRNSFRFRLQNSSYRGVRFSFRGSNGGAYAVFLGHLLIMVATAYIAAPLFHHRLKNYQHGNSYYGQTASAFTATDGQFFRAYGPVFVLVGVMFVALIAAITGVVIAAGGKAADPRVVVSILIVTFGILFGSMLFITPVWQARTQNLIWNHTRLGEHRFESELRIPRLFWIHLSNFILVILTLGFFAPWAAVRVARYRAESLRLLPAGSIDAFVAEQERAIGAVGEEAAEVFDVDIGL